MIGASLLILDVQMELLQICGKFMMAIILQLSLCMYELQGLVVYVDDRFLPLECNSSIISRPTQ